MRKITRALGAIHLIPDRAYLKLAYRLEFGEKLDLEEPATFNQKLQWLKLNGATFRFSHLADKAQARDYVEKVLGPRYLVPLLGLYDDPKQIPWHALPAQFVAKCTHGSHCGVVCRDPAQFSPRAAQRKLRKWMRRSWYWFGREPVYLGIRPQVMVEKYLGLAGQPPMDYKVMCFNGEPRVVQVHQKVAGGHAITFYDVDGERLGLGKAGYPITGPKRLAEDLLKQLLPAARKLAQSVDTPYLRTDFYWLQGHLLFSELTFFDSSGFKAFTPEGADLWLGKLLRLDPMTCPKCGARMKWRTIMGSRWCDKVERYDQCPSCGHQRRVDMESSS